MPFRVSPDSLWFPDERGGMCIYNLRVWDKNKNVEREEKKTPNRPECNPVEHLPEKASLPFWSRCLSPPLTASRWQLAPCQWHVVDGCHRCHCQQHDNAASNAGQREMKEAQRRGQANYSDTQLRADGDGAHQQPVWVINTFCHRRSHLCSERLMARRRGPADSWLLCKVDDRGRSARVTKYN